jgi:hypothetical protein
MTGSDWFRDKPVNPDHITLLGCLIDQPHTDHRAAVMHPKGHCVFKTLEYRRARRSLLSTGGVLRLVFENGVPEQHWFGSPVRSRILRGFFFRRMI